MIVQGTPIPAGPVARRDRRRRDGAGITLHLVAPPGLDAGPIAELAAASGGLVPVAHGMVAEMDR